MRGGTVVLLVVVLGVATGAGVAYSCSTSPPAPALIWLNPTATPSPISHTYIVCSVSGQKTSTLTFSASTLGPGDGCEFAADLSNTGSGAVSITTHVSESTPSGDPTFSTCFSFVVSSGPPSGTIPGKGSFLYTFSVEVLGSAPSVCEGVAGTVTVGFTGSPPCSQPGRPPGWVYLGPGANLKDANLAGLDLSGRNMAWDNLAGADLACANLRGTDLQSANLQGANLTYANLTGAYLPCASLLDAELYGATLSGADFQGANLQSADLSGALVTGFPYQWTNFNGANLDGVNIAAVTATGYITAVGASTTGTLNVASCASTSGTATYCDLL